MAQSPRLLVVLACLLTIVLGIGQKSIISFNNGTLQLAGSSVATLYMDTADFPGVLRAGQDLAADFGRVTGNNLTVTKGDFSKISIPLTSGPTIIVGTIGKSSLISSLVTSGKIYVSTTQGKWESFQSQVVADPLPGLTSALIISGSDKRGTIYGIYDISEQIGVSPWYWFADVPATPQTNIYADGIKVQGPPSVKYRGIFLNDEQPALTNWVKEKYGGVGYVSGFYSRVFELLLRLRANYLWPAMWDSMFALDDTENQPLADTYGIVMGTSHTEPLMRSTKEQSTYMSGAWDWSSNKAGVVKFLTDGVKRSKGYESLYTMGMRGSGDTASSTLTASLLQDVVTSQQGILTSVLGGSLSSIPQMWCLYKEVGGYYQSGMKVPDDVTLLWSDDNWGNMQRLPVESERNRSGGAGIYYHFDYVGDPRNYKWINTIQIQKTWEQLHHTYAKGADRIWVVNVGDLKPLELPISYFLDMAYDMTLLDSPQSISTWLGQWATREFGSGLSSSVASILDRYGRFAGRRKYELLDATIYSVYNYNETDRVLDEWKVLVSDAQKIYDSLPSGAQPAFFELVLHPCKAGYILHQLYSSTAKNNLYAKQGRVSAATYGAMASATFSADAALATTYHKLLGGKWDHMMDQTHIGYTSWQQPSTNSMPPQSYPSHSTNTSPGIFLSGGSTTVLPTQDPYSHSTAWIDIYAKSNNTNPLTFTVNSDPWILATPQQGSLVTPGLTSDQRILISIDWTQAPNGTSTSNIQISAWVTNFTVSLPLRNIPIPNDFNGFVESDKIIAIEAEHFTNSTSSSSTSYSLIPGYGKTISGVSLFPVSIPTQTPPGSPRLSYNIYVFTPNTTATINVFLGGGLNTDPSRPLAYAVSIDDESPTVVKYIPVTNLGTLPSGWANMVENAGWSSSSKQALAAGEHRLDVWALEPGVVVQRIVIDLGGMRASYLGPPESVRV